MRAELKSFDEIPSTAPDPGGRWYEMVVGPVGGEGGDLFQILVCTPAWLERDVDANGSRRGFGTLIVPRLNDEVVHRELKRLVESTWGDTWSDIAGALSRFALWEFEDYQEYRPN